MQGCGSSAATTLAGNCTPAVASASQRGPVRDCLGHQFCHARSEYTSRVKELDRLHLWEGTGESLQAVYPGS